MKNKLSFTLLALAAITAGANLHARQRAEYQTIPLPHEVTVQPGRSFLLGADVRIKAAAGLDSEARLLAGYLPAGLAGVSTGDIELRADLADSNPEAYTIDIDGDRVVINGASAAGVFYGVQTLRKSLPAVQSGDEAVELPPVHVYDRPRFGYRGMHLDVARHFFGVDEVKTYIDMIALHGGNTLHLHLTDDQGWRVEIQKYPLLTKIGSHRDGTIVGRTGPEYDGIPVDGFYTRAQIADIIGYAAERHIQVIPEIDLPSHMVAALASYPYLGCTGGPYEVWGRWGIREDVLCPGKDSTMQFIADVLDEVMDMFPAPYIHIGGDECPKTRWAECPDCQARIKQLGLVEKDGVSPEAQLQGYVTAFACDVVRRHGKSAIGWDELLECEIPDDAIVMSWHGVMGATEGTKRGHRVILTPSQYCYFDYFQSPDGPGEPFAVGGLTSVEKVYSLEPCPEEMPARHKELVMGVQANLWTEYIKTFDHVQYNVLPRMAALAEVQWVDSDRKDFESFRSRVPQIMSTYDMAGYNYAKHIGDVNVHYETDREAHALTMTCTALPGYEIRYTLDGSEPSTSSALYTGPLSLDRDCIVKVNTFHGDGIPGKAVCDTLSINKLTFGKVTLVDEPYYVYAFQGAPQLVDGLRGTKYFRTGRWLGFSVKDIDATVELDEPAVLSAVTFNTVVKPVDALADAEGAEVYGSVDGETFTLLASQQYEPDDPKAEHQKVTHTLTFEPVKLKKIRVVIHPVKKLPANHPQGGWPALLFVDEIIGR